MRSGTETRWVRRASKLGKSESRRKGSRGGRDAFGSGIYGYQLQLFMFAKIPAYMASWTDFERVIGSRKVQSKWRFRY